VRIGERRKEVSFRSTARKSRLDACRGEHALRATEFFNIFLTRVFRHPPSNLEKLVTYMNTKNPARFYETLHIYIRVCMCKTETKAMTMAAVAIGRKRTFRSETFMIHTVRDHRFELIRRQSFAVQIKIIHRINLISLYGRFILWRNFQRALDSRLAQTNV